MPRPLRPGDILRVPPCIFAERRQWSQDDADTVTDVFVDFNSASPGLSHVNAVSPNVVTLTQWHYTTMVEIAPEQLLPYRLNLWQRLTALERLGEWIVRRHLRSLNGTGPRVFPQLLTRAIIRQQRDRLPGMETLGGRWHPWWRRVLKSWARQKLANAGAYPLRSGSRIHGMMIDGIDRDIRFTYYGQPRVLRLDHIREHPNGNIHLIGWDPNAEDGRGGRRRFNLDRCSELILGDDVDLKTPGASAVEIFTSELKALMLSPGRFQTSRADMCRRAGLPPPPKPSAWAERVAQWFERWATRPMLAPPSARPPIPNPDLSPSKSAASQPARWAVTQQQDQPKRGPLHPAYCIGAVWRQRMIAAIGPILKGHPPHVRIFNATHALLGDPVLARDGLRRMLEAAAADNVLNDEATLIAHQTAKLMPDLGCPISTSNRADARAAHAAILADPAFPNSRLYRLSALCLESAFQLKIADDAPLLGNSAPERRSFIRANRAFACDWAHGAFRLNVKSTSRMMRLLTIWETHDRSGGKAAPAQGLRNHSFSRHWRRMKRGPARQSAVGTDPVQEISVTLELADHGETLVLMVRLGETVTTLLVDTFWYGEDPVAHSLLSWARNIASGPLPAQVNLPTSSEECTLALLPTPEPGICVLHITNDDGLCVMDRAVHRDSLHDALRPALARFFAVDYKPHEWLWDEDDMIDIEKKRRAILSRRYFRETPTDDAQFPA